MEKTYLESLSKQDLQEILLEVVYKTVKATFLDPKIPCWNDMKQIMIARNIGGYALLNIDTPLIVEAIKKFDKEKDDYDINSFLEVITACRQFAYAEEMRNT